jgi:hypothetical protein
MYNPEASDFPTIGGLNGNIEADPLFANAMFNLQSNSPCRDRGTAVIYPLDFDGDTRPPGYIDIGAQEYP